MLIPGPHLRGVHSADRESDSDVLYCTVLYCTVHHLRGVHSADRESDSDGEYSQLIMLGPAGSRKISQCPE